MKKKKKTCVNISKQKQNYCRESESKRDGDIFSNQGKKTKKNYNNKS